MLECENARITDSLCVEILNSIDSSYVAETSSIFFHSSILTNARMLECENARMWNRHWFQYSCFVAETTSIFFSFKHSCILAFSHYLKGTTKLTFSFC